MIMPLIIKSSNKSEIIISPEMPVKNLKSYVSSNNVVMGKNADAWRVNTLCTYQEMYGASSQNLNDDKIKFEKV